MVRAMHRSEARDLFPVGALAQLRPSGRWSKSRKRLRPLLDLFWTSRSGQGAQGFPEDQIQLIGIEARVFDDLADLETLSNQ
jgi:hypothetical protein